MRAAVRAACLDRGAWDFASIGAQTATLLEKFKDWSAYAATGTPKVCFAVAKPKQLQPAQGVKRGPIFFYISRWPADNVDERDQRQDGLSLQARAPRPR